MLATRAAAPSIFSIPLDASFADALATELVRQHWRDPLALARGRILLPNARAVRTVTEAFVRASGKGLLLPRLIPIGDPSLDERVGGAFEPMTGETIAPAIDPLTRLAELAREIRITRGGSTAESWRLAAELARTLDQLQVEKVPFDRLGDRSDLTAELAEHHQRALRDLTMVLDRWPERLRELGRIDLADRRNQLLAATARRWSHRPREGFTIAAGITTAAPAIAELLGVVARMPEGSLVLPGVADARLLPDEEWEALGGEREDQRKAEPTHPQYHLKLLLERLGISRSEVQPWPVSDGRPSLRRRSRVAAQALTAAAFSHRWSDLPRHERVLSGVSLAVLPDPAAEAQAIALKLRQALDTEGKTAALVTPDRSLARRVAAQLRRWKITADDSAGTPLSLLAPGTLLLGIAHTAVERLAPVSLVALLGHPLVRSGEGRQGWLDDVRELDLALRGPRPPAGLAGIDQLLAGKKDRAKESWARIRAVLPDLGHLLGEGTSLADLARGLRETATALTGEAAWSGAAGRAAADLLAALEASESCAALPVGADDAVPLLRHLLDGVAIRPPYGQHPRIQILGLLEARLVKSDLMILGGLNEGSWPPSPSPDPWLPARLRGSLGLPGPETRIGLAAHDFSSLLCAPQVLLTRAKRDGRSPTVSSRLLLRLQALTAGLPRDRQLERLALTLDVPAGEPQPAPRPQPRPPAAERPRHINVTALDRLKADPFAFYAQAMLRLRSLEPLEAELDARWKGELVHEVLERWLKDDECAPDKLLARAEALLAADDLHPMLRALWGPRLLDGIAFFAEQEAKNQAEGRRPLLAEAKGQAEVAGVKLMGRADRIDRLADGRLAILDYKTGKPPSKKQVEEGFALQLGLLGLIAARDGFSSLANKPGAFEYWSLAKSQKTRRFGFVETRGGGDADAFLADTHRIFQDAVEKWLLGDEPFTAKLRPAYAPYDDYDQLMRLEEWIGRKR